MNDKIDIFDSVKSEAINELTPEILETGFDLITDSEVLKEIPILELLLKVIVYIKKLPSHFLLKNCFIFYFN